MTDDPKGVPSPDDSGDDSLQMEVDLLEPERWGRIAAYPVSHYLDALEPDGMYYGLGVSDEGRPQLLLVAQGAAFPMAAMMLAQAGIIQTEFSDDEDDAPEGAKA